jgi:SPP1 gp7 family putative phage head morphogenesis protein
MRLVHENARSDASNLVKLLAEEPAQTFMRLHAEVLNEAFKVTPMTDIMRDRLEHSDLVFSGFKTFHEMHESLPSLLNDDGTRKPFNRFLDDVREVDRRYNRDYLKSEYNFVVASGSMAAKWEDFNNDSDSMLQYRTVGDDRVRDEHRAIDGVTLPKDSPFWDENYPPNGWGCRCDVVEVLSDKYPKSDEARAIELGREATSGKHAVMFRFNAGKQRAAFPPYNPYTIPKCKTCPRRTQLCWLPEPSEILASKAQPATPAAPEIPQNELCAACLQLRHTIGKQK